MTVLPLYCIIWDDRPTSLPPPKFKNISSSEGSIGSSASDATADSLRLVAMLGVELVWPTQDPAVF